jgi:hypothetical protein
MAEQITLRKRLGQLVAQHGSLRAVARVTEIDYSYLSRIGTGEKSNPSDFVLRRLGLRKSIVYELRATKDQHHG